MNVQKLEEITALNLEASRRFLQATELYLQAKQCWNTARQIIDTEHGRYMCSECKDLKDQGDNHMRVGRKLKAQAESLIE
jgi:hypothetical protein